MADEHEHEHEHEKELAERVAVRVAEIVAGDLAKYHFDCPIRRNLSDKEVVALKDFIDGLQKAKSAALAIVFGLVLTSAVTGALAMFWYGFKASLAQVKP